MIVIVDYGLGNLASVQNMLHKVGGECIISGDPDVIAEAERLILPGVGFFATGMRNMRERGIVAALDHAVLRQRRPVLGICLGMQLMARHGQEGDALGLAWFDADVVRFDQKRMGAAKVPHMGWSVIAPRYDHPVLPMSDNEERFYFVHTYYAVCERPADVLADCDHGYTFTCVIAKDNIIGVQFHPEKSHRFGMALMQRFIDWTPA